MKTFKGILGVIVVAICLVGMLSSCAAPTIERSVKAKQYSFARKCAKGTCESYGAGKRGSYQHKNYGF